MNDEIKLTAEQAEVLESFHIDGTLSIFAAECSQYRELYYRLMEDRYIWFVLGSDEYHITDAGRAALEAHRAAQPQPAQERTAVYQRDCGQDVDLEFALFVMLRTLGIKRESLQDYELDAMITEAGEIVKAYKAQQTEDKQDD